MSTYMGKGGQGRSRRWGFFRRFARVTYLFNLDKDNANAAHGVRYAARVTLIGRGTFMIQLFFFFFLSPIPVAAPVATQGSCFGCATYEEPHVLLSFSLFPSCTRRDGRVVELKKRVGEGVGDMVATEMALPGCFWT